MTTATLETKILPKRYNGWANYETWNVALWIQNDQWLYNTAKACVTYCAIGETPYDKFIRCMENVDMFTTKDGVRWDDEEINCDEILEMMNEL